MLIQGARVVVHSPDTMPLPATDGHDVPGGFSVSVGVRARENVRITEPHGKCSVDSNPNATYYYTLISCQLKCIQESIMVLCNCTDNRLPEVEWDGPRPPYCLELPVLPSECAVTDDGKFAPSIF
jgi:Amiloride-sensitive sodium channel